MMLLKRSAAALCTCSGALSIPFPPLPATSQCQPQHPRNSVPRPCHASEARYYASICDDKSGHKGSDGGPPAWPTSKNPTPYEVLGLARGAPYSKARYYQLAKLYHPDRQQHTSRDGIPHLTKLERYRLVVAANEILSNPQKKRMYDVYGFGWDNKADSQTRHREADRAWRQEPGNASMNATWEDWERWHQERDGSGREKQEQLFTSNLGFMAIVSLFLIVGTWAQMTRAGTNSVHLMDMRDEQHAAISRQLRMRQAQRAGLDRDGRVETFLRQRELEKWAYDPPGHGIPPPEESEHQPSKAH